MNVSGHDAVMPLMPIFHVNASSLPYAVPLTGAKMVFPGLGLYGKSLYELFEQEQVTGVTLGADRLAQDAQVNSTE